MTDQIISTIKYSTDYQINKQVLREKIQTDLHFPYQGGLFKATPELIAFVHAWSATDTVWPWGGGRDIIMEDTYGTPIHILNREDFYKVACEHYQQVMNTWCHEHSELKQIRKV
jgi:hypothetical protein